MPRPRPGSCRRILPLFLLLAAAPAAARNVYVDAVAGSDATGDGSLAAPWKSLTHALAQGLAAADHVYLAAGLYDAANGEAFPIAVPQDVSLHGAAGGGTVLRDDLAPGGRPTLAADIGSALGSLWVIEKLEVAGSGVAAGAVGIALTPGRGQGPVLGGNFIHGFATGVQTRLQVVSGTDLDLSSRPFIDGNRFEGNDVAIAIVYDIATTPGRVRERTEVVNNFIVGNRVGYHATASCTGCGATTVSIDHPVINNTFAGNSGDAVLLEGGDCSGVVTNSPEFANNVFAGNSGRSIGHDACSIPLLVESNDFWQNGPGGDEPAAGNFFFDPGFLDAAGGDYHLAPGSPCIDVGTLLADPATDYDGDPRILDGNGDLIAVTDLGADEYRPVAYDLLRAVFTAIDPPAPALALVFPFGRGNPLTPVVRANLLPGDSDPTPDILTDPRFQLALYQVDPTPPSPLRCVKDAAGGTLRFTY